MPELELTDLEDLRVLLEAMRLVLAAEQKAVATLDIDELARASSEKQRLADELALVRGAMNKTTAPSKKLLERRLEISRLAGDVRALARANHALLADASQMIGHVLGTHATFNGYDRRARRSTEPRTTFAKAV